MERGGVEERNTNLQSTLRTQSRAGVSQAQERIREAITRNEQEKLTAVLHHMTTDALRESCQSGSVRGALGDERPYRDSIFTERTRANYDDELGVPVLIKPTGGNKPQSSFAPKLSGSTTNDSERRLRADVC